jgi:hypothetical protein
MRTSDVPPVPWRSLPPIAKGRHNTPARGGCLMELASLLAGEVWSDRPDCVDPVLAAVARRVNDESTDGGRLLLLPLVPDLLGTADSEPAAAARVVAVCARTVLAVDGRRGGLTGRQRRRTRATLRTARHLANRPRSGTGGTGGHRPETGPPGGARSGPLVRWLLRAGDRLRLTEAGYRWLVAPQVADALALLAARAAGDRHDAVLRHLLRQCVAAHRRSSSPERQAATGPGTNREYPGLVGGLIERQLR